MTTVKSFRFVSCILRRSLCKYSYFTQQNSLLCVLFVRTGIRSFDTRNNVRYVDPLASSPNSSSDCVLYHAAGLGVLLDPVKNEQRFFRGHTDDIMSFALYVPSPEGT